MPSWTVQWVVSSIINAADGLEKGQVCSVYFVVLREEEGKGTPGEHSQKHDFFITIHTALEKNTASTVENPVQGSESDETQDKGGIYECSLASLRQPSLKYLYAKFQ